MKNALTRGSRGHARAKRGRLQRFSRLRRDRCILERIAFHLAVGGARQGFDEEDLAGAFVGGKMLGRRSLHRAGVKVRTGFRTM